MHVCFRGTFIAGGWLRWRPEEHRKLLGRHWLSTVVDAVSRERVNGLGI
jgi:hypothetical protein